MSFARVAFLLAAFALSACGGSSTTPDCAKDPSACACQSDSSCSGATPRCDTRTGQCVPCLPANDNCRAGLHCVSNGPSYTCVPLESCTAPADCPVEPGATALCCRGVCVNPLLDNTHCGACGNTCGSVPNGMGGCVKGACGVIVCDKGFGDCDLKGGNGCEVDLTTSLANCGDCGTPCKAPPNTTAACNSGQCQYTCVADFADCDNNQSNGCETSTTTNPLNCGGCGKTCAALPNTTAVACVASACVVAACKADFFDCNKQPGDGCEADIKNDPATCGGCGRKCPAVTNGAAGCSGGNCGIGKCNPGFDDCDKNVLNGCEQDLSSDAKNCGACGKTCVIANGVAICQAGKCVLQACDQGWADCDANAANGCEINITRDLKNCGACANACPVPPNATAACSSGVCGIGSCIYGKGDCNNNLGDGCETDLLTTKNCGACGNVCPAYQNAVVACPNAACVIGSCNAGFADCDMKAFTGCEVPITADPKNCNGCGIACLPDKNQAPVCVNSKCGVSGCLPGWSDCNKNLADGCEADTNSDPNNCGACGNVCPNNAALCSGGKCVACGNDCWGATGCLTGQGKCIMFTCRAGSAGGSFCDQCKGWKEVTYDQWMNQGYCSDIIARYRQSDGTTTKCGNNNLTCCNGSNNCGGGDNAWHFYDANGKQNYYTGPCLGCVNDVNCKYWNNVDNSAYTRITACIK